MLSDFILMFCSYPLQGSLLCSILYRNDCNLVSSVDEWNSEKSFPKFVFLVFQTSVHILPSDDCFGHMSDLIN